jgi:hypothetical protein
MEQEDQQMETQWEMKMKYEVFDLTDFILEPCKYISNFFSVSLLIMLFT